MSCISPGCLSWKQLTSNEWRGFVLQSQSSQLAFNSCSTFSWALDKMETAWLTIRESWGSPKVPTEYFNIAHVQSKRVLGILSAVPLNGFLLHFMPEICTKISTEYNCGPYPILHKQIKTGQCNRSFGWCLNRRPQNHESITTASPTAVSTPS